MSGKTTIECNDRSIRVLNVINWLNRGGLEVYLMNMLRQIDREKFQFDFCCKGEHAGEMAAEAESLGASVFHIPMGAATSQFERRLAELLQRRHYDVVHSHLSELGGPSLRASKRVGVPVRVAGYHSTQTRSKEEIVSAVPLARFARKMYLSRLQTMCEQNATHIVGYSRANLDSFFPGWRTGSYGLPASVLPLAVDEEMYSRPDDREVARKELGIPRGRTVIGHVGSFRAPKNHQGIIEIAARLIEGNVQIMVLLIGDGPLRTMIEQEIDRRNLRSFFVVTGKRTDVPRLLRAMDLFLMPSSYEGFGLVLLEAQLSELLCVASDLPGIREALCPVWHEFLCPSDDYESFAKAASLLVDSEERNAGKVNSARQWVLNNYSLENATARLQDFYQGAVNGVRRGE